MIKRLSFLFLINFMCLEGICQGKQVNNSYESGQIKDGYMVGIWEYKGIEGDTELKIDYDKGTILYLKPDTTEYLVKVDSSWVLRQLSRHPRYLGSYAEFYQIISSNLRYPAQARRKGIQRTVLLEFEVNPQGQASNFQVLHDEDDYFASEIIETFKLIPNIWMEAVYEGQGVPAKFILPFHFKIEGGKKTVEYDKDILEPYEAKKLSEVIVSAMKVTRLN